MSKLFLKKHDSVCTAVRCIRQSRKKDEKLAYIIEAKCAHKDDECPYLEEYLDRKNRKKEGADG